MIMRMSPDAVIYLGALEENIYLNSSNVEVN